MASVCLERPPDERFLFWLDSAHSCERLAHCPFLDTPQKRQWFVDSYCGGYESLKCSGGLNALGSIVKQLIDCDSGGVVGQISRILLLFDAVTLNWNAICNNESRFAEECRNKVASWAGISETTGIDMTPLRNRYGFMIIGDSLLPTVYSLENTDVELEAVFERGRHLVMSVPLPVAKQQFYLTLSEKSFGGHSSHSDARLAAARCVRLFERRRDAEDFCEAFDGSSLGVELYIVGISAEAPEAPPSKSVKAVSVP